MKNDLKDLAILSMMTRICEMKFKIRSQGTTKTVVFKKIMIEKKVVEYT